MKNKSKASVSAVAKQQQVVSSDSIILLSTGIRAKIKPVPASLLDKVAGHIPDPKPPKQLIEDKGREEINPFDPEYLRLKDEALTERGRATTEAMVMFGIELVDEIPPNEEWLPPLRFLEKRGRLDLKEWNIEDEIERELLYKLFVAVANVDIMLVSAASGVSQEEVEQAMRGFLGSETQPADSTGVAEE